MKELYVYNSLSAKKEKFIPLKEKEVKMYVCGPTVYDSAHVGHALSAMVFDIIRRYLEYSTYEVKLIMNFTDVDDKIIIKANNDNISTSELTEKLMNEYLFQLKELNILPATKYPKATEEISEMISFINTLLEKNYAYYSKGNVFFRAKSFKEYGKLSNRKIEDQLSKNDISLDKEKNEDFTLWKAAKALEPFWESPWGNGRPGWHIECSAMCVHHLGEQIDIHGGGNDLLFPHHENEIAQSEAYTGKQFAKYWLHNGMLELQGGKMSKSSGGLVTIEEFLSKYDANIFRMMIISSHYRNSLAFSFELAEESSRKIERIKNALKPSWGNILDDALKTEIEKKSQNFVANFVANMNDDFNTPLVLKEIFSFSKYINSLKTKEIANKYVLLAQEKLKFVLNILGFDISKFYSQNSISIENNLIEILINLRQELKEEKNWKLADKIREELKKVDIILEDKQNITLWTKK